jgi:Leucine-rich repeat (LRR) protein
MKSALNCLFLFLFLAKSHAQNVVEIVKVDSLGVVKTIRTNRPDTLVKGNKPTQIRSVSNTIEQPIFKNKADSILYEKVDRAIPQEMSVSINNTAKLDSLLALARQLRERIIGYRKVFIPNRGFFFYDSLPFITDKSNIQRISISGLKARRVPEAILACKNLVELELVNTSIKKIQRKLKRLSHLKAIYVYNNQPASGALVLKKNTTVTNLLIRGDKPKKLPQNYSSFRSLIALDLAQNALTYFPNGTSKNKKLAELILNNNGITLEQDNIKHTLR